MNIVRLLFINMIIALPLSISSVTFCCDSLEIAGNERDLPGFWAHAPSRNSFQKLEEEVSQLSSQLFYDYGLIVTIDTRKSNNLRIESADFEFDIFSLDFKRTQQEKERNIFNSDLQYDMRCYREIYDVLLNAKFLEGSEFQPGGSKEHILVSLEILRLNRLVRETQACETKTPREKENELVLLQAALNRQNAIIQKIIDKKREQLEIASGSARVALEHDIQELEKMMGSARIEKKVQKYQTVYNYS